MLESGRNRAVGHEALLFVNPSHNMTSKGDMKDRKISLSAQKKDLSVKRKGITLQYLCKKFRNSVSAMTWGCQSTEDSATIISVLIASG
ncbi:hypothetical protein SNK03_13649 [Fusarium graminearum]